jgi:hypothetical protein
LTATNFVAINDEMQWRYWSGENRDAFARGFELARYSRCLSHAKWSISPLTKRVGFHGQFWAVHATAMYTGMICLRCAGHIVIPNFL